MIEMGCAAADGCDAQCTEEPWSLFGTTCRGWHLGGWIEAGATANGNGSPSNFNGVIGFNDREEVQLDQFMVFAEKQLDPDCCGWNWGGRVELMYGRDSMFIGSNGWELHRDGSRHWNGQRFYGLAMPQAYAEAGNGDLSIKLGKFVTLMEYEVIAAPGNFFYSHSYGFLYAVPFTHTGALATWKQNDNWTWMAGLVNGWDQVEGLTNQAAFHGGVTYTPDHGQYKIILAVHSGIEPDSIDGRSARTGYSFIFDYTINDCWEYVLVQDSGWQRNGNGSGETAEWYGINNYLFRKINDCWKAGVRFEWFRDDDGFRVAGGGDAGNPNDGGYFGNFYEISLGLNWTPNANLWVRPELRYDYFDADAGSPLPFDDETKHSQLTAAFDVILTY